MELGHINRKWGDGSWNLLLLSLCFLSKLRLIDVCVLYNAI